MKDMWVDSERRRERIVAIEYIDGKPHSVMTEEHWDHTRKPWFRAGLDAPTGTTAHHWNFDWSRIDHQLYYHQSGFGGDPSAYHVSRFVHPDPPPGRLWLAPGVKAVTTTKNFRSERTVGEAELLRSGYRLLDRPLLLPGLYGSRRCRDPFAVATEADVVYCETCDDWRPASGYSACEHVEWCDECSMWVYTANRESVEEDTVCPCERVTS